jgi:two-component system chemotaxis response regulator CheB
MARRAVPIVLISVLDGAGAQVLQALEAGAVDFVQKPTALASARILDVSAELIAKVKTAASVRQRLT